MLSLLKVIHLVWLFVSFPFSDIGKEMIEYKLVLKIYYTMIVNISRLVVFFLSVFDQEFFNLDNRDNRRYRVFNARLPGKGKKLNFTQIRCAEFKFGRAANMNRRWFAESS